jgi:hypothetical protein
MMTRRKAFGFVKSVFENLPNQNFAQETTTGGQRMACSESGLAARRCHSVEIRKAQNILTLRPGHSTHARAVIPRLSA